jgi:hypothetical protein
LFGYIENSHLYIDDAIELTSIYLGIKADDLFDVLGVKPLLGPRV